jgi:hypothetical protein
VRKIIDGYFATQPSGQPAKWLSEYTGSKRLLDFAVPYIIVGQETFPLGKHLVHPQPGNQMKMHQSYENLQFSSELSRKNIRKCFSCLGTKFSCITEENKHLTRLCFARFQVFRCNVIEAFPLLGCHAACVGISRWDRCAVPKHR